METGSLSEGIHTALYQWKPMCALLCALLALTLYHLYHVLITHIAGHHIYLTPYQFSL